SRIERGMEPPGEARSASPHLSQPSPDAKSPLCSLRIRARVLPGADRNRTDSNHKYQETAKMVRSLLLPLLAAASIGTAHAQAQNTVTPEAVLKHYGTLVHASYEDSLATAKKLQQAIHAFVAAPSEAGLQNARKAWLEAREWYGQTEAFRFYGGPIDGEDGPEGQINAWPMDEA